MWEDLVNPLHPSSTARTSAGRKLVYVAFAPVESGIPGISKAVSQRVPSRVTYQGGAVQG